MITLYTFGPAVGLPDLSPFVTKAEMLLKLAGLDYGIDTRGFRKAPKGKLPFIDDDGEAIADSTFIRWHIEKKYGFDFDRGLDIEQRAVAWTFERMFEDHLYWAFLHARWADDGNFDRGPSLYFQVLPFPVRRIALRKTRRNVLEQIKGHGMGRHSDAEIVALGTRSVDAAAEFLARKPYMMGAAPTGLDATAFAFMLGALCPVFDTPLRTAVERHGNVKAYVGRMAERYYPEYADIRDWVA